MFPFLVWISVTYMTYSNVFLFLNSTSTPATLEQNYIVCELKQKISVLYSFLRSHLKKKSIVFFSSCKEVLAVYFAFWTYVECPFWNGKSIRQIITLYEKYSASCGEGSLVSLLQRNPWLRLSTPQGQKLCLFLGIMLSANNTGNVVVNKY